MKRFLYKIIGKASACQSLSNKHTMIMRENRRRLISQKCKDNSPHLFKAGQAVSKIRAEKYRARHGKEAAMIPTIKRGDIFYADLSPVVGSEQGGLRPVLIIQNDVGNKYSPTVIAAAITSRMGKARLPTHIDIHADGVGLSKDSVVLLEQIRTLDKRRLREKMGHLDGGVMARINSAIAVSFGLGVIPEGYEGAASVTRSGGAVALRDTAEVSHNNGLLG